ncbi:MAG: class I SAM-dependent DNA methyltransferase [Parasphingopyxis sp.]|uniref:class I SAM-dependent DNA methyltransferase n=1 Tax=Parasphingopyxis sp. TaxID=1920299 RepID=UPI003FA1575A
MWLEYKRLCSQQQSCEARRGAIGKQYAIRFPEETSYELGQNEAFFYLDEGDDPEKVRFHDYSAIYERAGLYEQLFYERLQCRSPEVVVSRLERALSNAGQSLSTMRVLDLGAGNGIVGEALRARGIARVVGLDIIPAAHDAAARDRPGVYDDYFVADITDLPKPQEEALGRWNATCLTCVAALGFDDIPAPAFIEAMNLVSKQGWLAFNVKADFLGSASPFAELVKAMLMENLVDLHLIERYWHRLSIDGDWLEYFVVVAKKRGHLPEKIVRRFNGE